MKIKLYSSRKAAILSIILGVIILLSPIVNAATYTYDDLSRLIMVDYGNGHKLEYTYDAGGNILTAQSTTVQSAVYYHVYGDIVLNGASKEHATVNISGGDIDITASYGEETVTVCGKVYLGDLDDEQLSYYFDVPNGTYNISATSGNQSAAAVVTTNSNTNQDLGYGAYYMQQVGDLTLSAVPSTLTGISINPISYSLQVGESHSTVVTAVYSGNSSCDVTNYSTFESSAPEVATVDDSGVVTGVSVGNAVIKAMYSGEEATAAVNVYQTGGGGGASQPSVQGAVYADGVTVTDIDVFFAYDPNQKLAQVQLKKDNSYELSDTYNSDTVFTIKLNNDLSTPYIVLGAGNIQSWTNENDTTTISVKGVSFKPSPELEVQLGVTLAVQYGPLPEIFPDEYQGMYISTNGNQFTTPYKDPDTQKLGVMVGGVDGESGFFKAFLPDALLQSWGVTTPSQLQAFIGDHDGGNRQAVNAPTINTVSGGVVIGFNMSFSVHQVYIGSQDDNIAPVYQGALIDGANKVVTITFSENLVNNRANADELKSAIALAADGTNFTALNLEDTVTINGNTLVVTFNNALMGNNNKIKVVANTLKDTVGNVLASEVSTAAIAAVDNTPPTVSATPTGGLYNTAQTVTLTSSEEGNIYLTTNGNAPTTSSARYTGPINIRSLTTLKFMAVDQCGNQSAISTEIYTIDTKSPTLIVNPPGGQYNAAQSVTLMASEQATIYYTTNGTEPTTNSSQYTGPVNIGADTTLKFIAVDQAGNHSNIYTETYTVNTIAQAPTLVNAATNPSGNKITLVFSKAMANPVGKQAETTVLVNNSGNPVTSAALNENSSKIELTLTNLIKYGDIVTVAYTAGTITSADGGVLATFPAQAVTNRVPKPIATPTVVVDNNSKDLAITDNTPAAVTVTVPDNISDATINVATLLNNPVNNIVNTDPLPQLTIQATTPVSASPVQIVIPAGTVVNAAASDSWDGTINVPTVKPNNTVVVTPDAGKTATVNTVIEIGFGDKPLTFNKAVRLLIPGQAGKEAGYYRGSTFTKITTVLGADTQAAGDALPEGGDGKIDVVSDLVIWTKHFTKFVTYSQTVSGNIGGGGNGGGINPASNVVEKPIQLGKTTIAEIPGKIKVEVPVETVTSSNASILLEPLTDSRAQDAGMKLISPVVDVKLKNGTLSGKLNITLNFDKSKLGKNQEPQIFYNEGSKWINIKGTVDYEKETVTVSVDHLTLFAVFAVTKEVPKQSTFTDTQGHWAEQNINRLAGMGIISGYPDGTFKPENVITRAEVTAILVKALNLKPGIDELSQFADTASIPTWAKQPIAIAAREGLVRGYLQLDGTMTFEAEKPLSRAELAAMTARIVINRFGPVTAPKMEFIDADTIPEWARGAVGTVINKGIEKGYPDNTFKSNNPITRAEAATIIVHLIDLK